MPEQKPLFFPILKRQSQILSLEILKNWTKDTKNKKRIIYTLLIVIVVTFISFIPALNNNFVDWDDNGYIFNNRDIYELSFENIKKIFTSFYVSSYVPLTVLSFAIEYSIVELNPFLYHFDNLILHLFNTALVFWLFYLIAARSTWCLKNKENILWIPFLCALFFGIHPTRVESVAWITERKDLLYALFYLGSLISYLYFREKPEQIRLYLLAIFLFVLSLFSKPMAVSLPVIFVLLDILEKRKIMITKIIPFFILSIVFGLVTIYGHIITEQKMPGRHFAKLDINPLERLCYVADNILFYIQKCLYPVKLSPVYKKVDEFFFSNTTIWIPLFIIVLLCIIIALVTRRNRIYAFGSLFFLITLAPVLQVFPQGAVDVADRFGYIPLAGIFFIISSLILSLILYLSRKESKKMLRIWVLIMVVALTGILCAATWKQCRIWKDSVTLWTHAISVDPNNDTPFFLRGSFYVKKRDFDRAIADFSKALKLIDKDSNAERMVLLHSRGRAFLDKGMIKRAIEDFNAALNINPDSAVSDKWFARILNDRGMALCILGDFEKGLADVNRAIKDMSDNPAAYSNAGLMLVKMGELESSLPYFKKAFDILEIIKKDSEYKKYLLYIVKGYYINTLVKVSETKIIKGDYAGAEEYMAKAVHINQKDDRLHVMLGVALSGQKKYRQAANHFKAALNLNKYNEQARGNLKKISKYLKE